MAIFTPSPSIIGDNDLTFVYLMLNSNEISQSFPSYSDFAFFLRNVGSTESDSGSGSGTSRTKERGCIRISDIQPAGSRASFRTTELPPSVATLN